MKKLILIRHAQTEKSKGRDRGLTKDGIEEFIQKLKKIKVDKTEKYLIVHTGKVRTQSSALLVKKYFKSSELLESSAFDIENKKGISHLIKEGKENGFTPAEVYFSLDDYEEYGVESPQEVSLRWEIAINLLDAESIIIVGHEGSLDSFFKNTKKFKLVQKSFEDLFGYSDFAVYISDE